MILPSLVGELHLQEHALAAVRCDERAERCAYHRFPVMLALVGRLEASKARLEREVVLYCECQPGSPR